MIKHLMIGAAATAMTAFTAGQASAAAVYNADAQTTLTLVSVQNMTDEDAGSDEFFMAIGTSLDQEGADTSGDATVTTNFTLDPFEDGFGVIQNSFGIGETLLNAGSVSGTANDGTSDAFVSTTGDLTFTNLSLTDTFEVTFELAYDLFAMAGADDLSAESANAGAFASAEASLVGDVTGTITQDGISTVLSDLVLDLALQPTAADGTLSDSGTLILSFIVAPDAGVDMFMFADVLGSSMGIADIDTNPIPLPGALGFMVFGAASFAGFRLRRSS